MELAGTALIVVLAVVALIAVAVVGAIYAKVRFKIATPDEALIITGRKSGKPVINPETGDETTDLSGQRVVIGGGTFVKPIFEQVVRLSLASQSFPVAAEDATTKSGVGVTLRSIAVVKVGGTERMVRAAAQRFAGRSQEQVIEQQTSEVLVGVLRTIAGTLTVESILYERQEFSKEVKDIAVPMLAERGLILENFEIQTVEDTGEYIRNLGRPRAAAVARDAEIAEAQARQESTERSNEAAVQIAESNKALALAIARAEADGIQARGEAEAAAERAQGEARAAAIKAESDAYQAFPESARLQMVLDALPKVAQPYADALGKIDDITIIDKDGASRLPGQVSTGVQELATMLKAQTGIDLLDLVRGLGGSGSATPAHAVPAQSHAAVAPVHAPVDRPAAGADGTAG